MQVLRHQFKDISTHDYEKIDETVNTESAGIVAPQQGHLNTSHQ